MIPAALVQATATNKTAPVNAIAPWYPRFVGRANKNANPTAMAPTWALQTAVR
jgi:hypothetical protein